MNVFLWIGQWLLAVVFMMAGTAKLITAKDKLSERMSWVEDFNAQGIKTIGSLEVLAALGLIVPWLSGIVTWLTPVAATGLVMLMTGAGVTHFRRKEYAMIAVNIVLLLVSAFVALGRFY